MLVPRDHGVNMLSGIDTIYQALAEEVASIPGLETEPSTIWSERESTGSNKIRDLRVSHFDKDGVRSYRGRLYISINSELVVIRENLVKFIVSMYDPECVDKLKVFLTQTPKQWGSLEEKTKFCESMGIDWQNNYRLPPNINPLL